VTAVPDPAIEVADLAPEEPLLPAGGEDGDGEELEPTGT
jgi:hypothetical protein